MLDSDGLPQLGATPGHLIRCAQQIHGNLWTREIGSGLTSVQFAVLLAVGCSPKIDQRTVGSRVSLDKSTTADVIGRLAQRELVNRERGEDGRRRILCLTDEGKRLVDGAASGVHEVQQGLLAPLAPATRRALLRVLRVVAYRGVPPTRDASGGRCPALPGWTTPPFRLHDAPGHLMRRAQQVHTALWIDRVSSDMSSVQYNVLLVLHHKPEIDQRTLGEHASLDKSTGGEIVARMMSRGLLQRNRDAGDGRRNIVRISPAGEALLAEHAPAVIEVQRQLLEPLDQHEQQLFVSATAQLVRAHLRPALAAE